MSQRDVLIGLVCVTVDERNKAGWFWYRIAEGARGLERLELGHRVDVDTYGRLRSDPTPTFEAIPMLGQ